MEYKVEERNNKRFLHLPKLKDMGLDHCFTTKDMDVGSSTNPDSESIQGYIDEVWDFMGVQPEILYNGYQEHSSNIEVIRSLDQGIKGQFGRFIPNTDGLLTNLEKVALLTRFADCVPIILYDPIKRVHGNIHSGWKGTLLRIVQMGVQGFVREYGSRTEDIIAIIGPAIGKDDFQVQSDVTTMFNGEFMEWNDLIRQVSEEKYLIDLKEINRRMLLGSGIRQENITVIDISTFEREDLCHSYRRDGSKFGLMGLFTTLEGR